MIILERSVDELIIDCLSEEQAQTLTVEEVHGLSRRGVSVRAERDLLWTQCCEDKPGAKDGVDVWEGAEPRRAPLGGRVRGGATAAHWS